MCITLRIGNVIYYYFQLNQLSYSRQVTIIAKMIYALAYHLKIQGCGFPFFFNLCPFKKYYYQNMYPMPRPSNQKAANTKCKNIEKQIAFKNLFLPSSHQLTNIYRNFENLFSPSFHQLVKFFSFSFLFIGHFKTRNKYFQFLKYEAMV